MSMQSAFYIVQTSPDWYRLHVTETHFCIAAGNDLDKLLNTVKTYVKRYKSEEIMLDTLSKLEFGSPNDLTVKIDKEDYLMTAHLFKDLVEKAVDSVYSEVITSRFGAKSFKATRLLRKFRNTTNQ